MGVTSPYHASKPWPHPRPHPHRCPTNLPCTARGPLRFASVPHVASCAPLVKPLALSLCWVPHLSPLRFYSLHFCSNKGSRVGAQLPGTSPANDFFGSLKSQVAQTRLPFPKTATSLMSPKQRYLITSMALKFAGCFLPLVVESSYPTCIVVFLGVQWLRPSSFNMVLQLHN